MDEQSSQGGRERPSWVRDVELVYLPDLERQEARRRRKAQKSIKTSNLETDSVETPAEPTPATAEPDSRHSRKCQICEHPDRSEIEEEFRNWIRPSAIARHYSVPLRALYRHLKGTGLAAQRRANLQVVLDRILERGAEAPITGDMIIRAQCCLTGDNRWVEPTRHTIHEYRTAEPLIDTTSIRNSPNS